MSSGITLSAATRQNLLSLQSTAALAATNQNDLATGKKVNSALDNPAEYFTSQSLTSSASALSNLLDGISNGIQTIQAANQGITSATSIVQQMQSVVQQMQTNAAQNLPKIASTQPLATSTEATATGMSQHDTAMAKTLIGTAAASTSSAPGVVGLASGDVVQIQAGDTTYDYTVQAGDTVNDLVNQINKSGIANATVDSNGQLDVTGTGSDPLTVQVGTVSSGTFTASTAETAKLFGTGTATSGVSGGGGSAARSALVDQFNDLRTQLDQIAGDSGYNGTNLLAGNSLKIAFNDKTGSAQSNETVQGMQINSSGLGIGSMVDSATSQTGGNYGVQNDDDLQSASDALTDALSTLKSDASTLSSSLSVVQTRQDFSNQMINILNTGAANLTNADMNELAAQSQALSTRQSLGISALSLANTAQQGVLQLLR